MKSIELKAELRELTKKNINDKKTEGKIPAVLYGQGMDNKNIWVDGLAFDKVFSVAGENTVVALDTKEGEKDNVLIYDYQINPLSGKVAHIDFLRVNMKEDIETEIPLSFMGEAPVVKENGATLIKVMDSVEVRCLPGDMPHEFIVDLTKLLNFEDRITVADLNVPANVEILNNADTIIASVSAPRSEEELAQLNEKVDEDVTKVADTKEKALGDEDSKNENKK
jgi:large subunit ribosomal protein L25